MIKLAKLAFATFLLTSGAQAATTAPGWSNGKCFEYDPKGHVVKPLDLSVCRKAIPSKPGWSNGKCFEYDPAGKVVQSLELSVCRKAIPSKPGWSNGKCFEYDPAGKVVSELNKEVCRKGAAINPLDPNRIVNSSAHEEDGGVLTERGRTKVIPQASTPEQPGSPTSTNAQ